MCLGPRGSGRLRKVSNVVFVSRTMTKCLLNKERCPRKKG